MRVCPHSIIPRYTYGLCVVRYVVVSVIDDSFLNQQPPPKHQFHMDPRAKPFISDSLVCLVGDLLLSSRDVLKLWLRPGYIVHAQETRNNLTMLRET